MSLSARKLNTYLLTKLPSAWLCGVRIKAIDANTCKVGVKHRWINQNPFNSLYFAVQAMAAELSTGALVMQQLRETPQSISMLVARNRSEFTKKAKGKIIFTCVDAHLIKEAVKNTLVSGEGQKFWMKSTGLNETGEVVAIFEFEWTIKVKNKI